MTEYYPFYIVCNNDADNLKNKLIKNQDILVIINADHIICEKQVKVGLLRASRSKARGTMTASKFAVEILLHIAGTHQIKTALQLLNVQTTTKVILFFQKQAEQLVEKSISGFPLFNRSIDRDDIYIQYGLNIEKGKNNYCKDIISKGARFILDHE